MIMRFLFALLVCVLALPAITAPVFAVQPDEVLADPALESRARNISRDLRCPVCQGESIDDSNAEVSRDLRLFVRERLLAGDSDAEVMDEVVARYGEYVLFEPRAEGANLVLYLAGPLALIIGGFLAMRYVFAHRRDVARAGAAGGLADRPLDPEEEARLAALLRQNPLPDAPADPEGVTHPHRG